MNDYIINPMWFYQLQLFESLSVFMGVIAIFVGTFTVVKSIIWLGEEYGSGTPFPKPLKICTFLSLLTLLISLLIPSKETMIEMELARHATHQNVTTVIEEIEKISKDIVKEIEE